VIRYLFNPIFVLLAVSHATTTFAFSTTIGIAIGNGEFQVGASTVSGNATLFEGTVIETAATPSLLQLVDGARIQLGAASRAMVYRDHLLLIRGEGVLERGDGYRLQAGDLEVRPASRSASAHVRIQGDERLQIVSLKGNLHVFNPAGVLIARLDEGNGLLFDLKGNQAAPPYAVRGCLQKSGGNYFVKDQVAGVVLRLKGENLDANVGRLVEVAGKGGGSDNTILVSLVRTVEGSCDAESGKTQTNAQDGAANSSSSTSPRSNGTSRTRKAVIGGVAIAGAAAGTTVGLIGRNETKKPTISR